MSLLPNITAANTSAANTSPPSPQRPSTPAPSASPPSGSQTTQGAQTGDEKSSGLFGALKDVLPVLAVYSFFAGWIYASAFYKTFRLPVSSLDIPFQYFFMYSFSALANWKGALLVLATAVCVSILRKHKLTMIIIASLLFPLVFGVAFVQGTADATLQRYSSTNDRIVLGFKEDSAKAAPGDLKLNNQMERLRLLTETKERIFLFYQPPAYAPDESPPVLVYDVAKSDLASVTRQVSDKRNLSLRETLWRIIHEQPAK